MINKRRFRPLSTTAGTGRLPASGVADINYPEPPLSIPYEVVYGRS